MKVWNATISSTVRSPWKALLAVLVLGAVVPGTAVADSPPVNTSVPVISGKSLAGQTLTTTDGSWTGTDPITFTYRWFRCDKKKSARKCKLIKKATRATYELTKKDAQHRMRVNILATNSAGMSAGTSEPTAIVKKK